MLFYLQTSGVLFQSLLPTSIFQDITVAIFLGVVIFGIAWVAIDELQKRKANKRFELTKSKEVFAK